MNFSIEQISQLRKLLERQTDAMPDEDIVNFSAFVEKWAPDTNYEVGKRLEYDGVIYKVLIAHKSQNGWKPDVSSSLFAKVLIPDPHIIPEWEQPGSTNPYMTGDKVTHNGKTWESTIDSNVWEPGVYGWNEI